MVSHKYSKEIPNSMYQKIILQCISKLIYYILMSIIVGACD